jgi:hypothetical protein
MQKHTFDITCHDIIFVEVEPVLPEHKKWYVDVWRPARTEMHYVTH